MLGIVIVNYNGEKFQNECISDILKSSFKDFVIIVVDNGSNDKSMSMLNVFNDQRIIKIYNNDNLGVAAGNNIGIKKSLEIGCDYTLLLNNDTSFDEDMILNLIRDKNYVASPKIFYENSNKIWYFGGKISFVRGRGIHRYFRKEKYKIKKYSTYAPTCCLLVKNSVFLDVGYFDENYFLYFDDTDFCYRLYRKNYKIKLINSSVVFHKVGMSSGGEFSENQLYYNIRNKFYFISKLPPFRRVIPYAFSYISMLVKSLKYPIIRVAYKDYKFHHLGKRGDK